MRRLFAIGEALIDFMPTVTNKALKDVEQFSRQVGGHHVMLHVLYKSLVDMQK